MLNITFYDQAGVPVAGAKVSAYDGSLRLVASGTTDAYGRVSLNVPSGTYWIEAWKETSEAFYNPLEKVDAPGIKQITFPWTRELSRRIIFSVSVAGQDIVSTILNALMGGMGLVLQILYGGPQAAIDAATPMIINTINDRLRSQAPGTKVDYLKINVYTPSIELILTQSKGSPVSTAVAALAIIIVIIAGWGFVTLLQTVQVVSRNIVESQRLAQLQQAQQNYQQAITQALNVCMQQGYTPEQCQQLLNQISSSYQKYFGEAGKRPGEEKCKVFGIEIPGITPEFCPLVQLGFLMFGFMFLMMMVKEMMR